MAKPETVVLSVRVSADLLAQVDNAGARTEVVQAALRQYFNPRAVKQSIEPVDPKRHHAAGPVLASAVPSVAGVATGFHPKASWQPEDKKGKQP
jgi:hypothetical protein